MFGCVFPTGLTFGIDGASASGCTISPFKVGVESPVDDSIVGVKGPDSSCTDEAMDSRSDEAGDKSRTDGERDRPAYTLLTILGPAWGRKASTNDPNPISSSFTPAGLIVSSELLGELCTGHSVGLGCTTRS